MSRDALRKFGYKFGPSGAHSARSMMLAELEVLFEAAPAETSRAQYQEDICSHNVLNKPTAKARNLTYRHLLDLYGLSPDIPLFRVFRRLWPLEKTGQPLLTLQMALARDSLLRLSQDYMVEKPIGEAVTRAEIENLLTAHYPDRFSLASLKSFAQNINGSWTQAGVLKGKTRKIRVKPEVAYSNLVFALFQAYLEGATGERLFQSRWTTLLCRGQDQLEELAIIAARRGIIDYRQSGGVTEVRFPDFLTPQEEQWRYE